MTEKDGFEAWVANEPVETLRATRRTTAERAWKSACAWQRQQDAEIARNHFIPGHTIAGPHFAAKCAEAILNQGKQNGP